MDIGCTSSRRLSFEDVEPGDIVADINKNELVNFETLNHEDDVLRIGLDFITDGDTHEYITHSRHHRDMSDEHFETELVNFKNLNSEEDVPKIGMSFNSEEEAYEFYLNYSRRAGFGIRRSKSHNDKSGDLVDRIFCCSAQGKRAHDKRGIYVKKARPETRFGCGAKMKVSRRGTGKLFSCFRELCSLYLQAVTKASVDEDVYRMAKESILKLHEMVDDRLQNKKANEEQGEGKQGQDIDQDADQTSLFLNGDGLQISERNIPAAKGIKYKKKTKSGKRIKSGLEKASGKKRASKKRKDQPTTATTSSQILSSNFEVMQDGIEILNTTAQVPRTSYQRLNINKAVNTSSNHQNFGGLPSSMSMTSLLLAQQQFYFDSMESNSLNNAAYVGDPSYNNI